MPANQLGDGPIEDAYRAKMQEIAAMLDEIFNGAGHGGNRRTGFVLLVFPFGENEGRCNYISNGAQRADVVTLMREQIKRFGGDN